MLEVCGMLSAFLELSFVYPLHMGLPLRLPEWGSHFLPLVCKALRHFMFIIVEFFSARLQKCIKMVYSHRTEFRPFTTYK